MTFTRALSSGILLLVAALAWSHEHPRAPLHILVYGATGEVGTHIVDEALARGHLVTAVSRNPASIVRQHPNLEAAKGDLLDAGSIALLIRGKDVIVTSVRGVLGDKHNPENALQYIAVRNVIEQMQTHTEAAARLIHVGGSGSLEVEPGVMYADRIPKLLISKRLESEIQGQILALQFLRTIEDVEWTYATPPKNFTNGPWTGDFRIGGDQVLEDRRGRSRLSRIDFAVAILDEAELERHTGRRFSVAY